MNIAEHEIDLLRERFAKNTSSPLFARLADLILTNAEKPNAAEALALCERGVVLYPDYASGHLVLGKCYQELGRVRDARTAFHRALELSPYNTVLQHQLVMLPDDETIVMSDRHPLAAAITPAKPNAEPQKEAPAADPAGSPFAPLPGGAGSTEDDAALARALSENAAQDDQETFEPFPTFEEYIGLHPAADPVMRLEEYLKGLSPLTQRPDPSPAGTPDASTDAPATAPPADTGESTAEAPRALDEFPVEPPQEIFEISSEEDFESLALKLQQAGRIIPSESIRSTPPPADKPEAEADDRMARTPSTVTSIVTPTMAEIYVAQKEYQAAIDAYTQLIEKLRGHASVFRERIEAITLLKGTS